VPQGHENELSPGTRFIALFKTPSNQEYFDSSNGACEFEKTTTKKIEYIVGLGREKRYQPCYRAVKMSSCGCKIYCPIQDFVVLRAFHSSNEYTMGLGRGQHDTKCTIGYGIGWGRSKSM
jgi:hypothetical protein